MNRMFSPFNSFMNVFQASITADDPRSVTDLFNTFVVQFGSGEYAELGALLAFCRAVSQIHQSNHWRAQGDTFYGDHLMFERIYGAVNEEVDSIAERAVGLGDESLVAPELLARMQSTACEWICSVYSNPSSLPMSGELVQLSLSAEECFYAALELCTQSLTERGLMKPGLKNMLEGFADTHESNQYLLQQAMR